MKLRVWLCSACQRQVPASWRPRLLDCQSERGACAACLPHADSLWKACELVELEPSR